MAACVRHVLCVAKGKSILFATILNLKRTRIHNNKRYIHISNCLSKIDEDKAVNDDNSQSDDLDFFGIEEIRNKTVKNADEVVTYKYRTNENNAKQDFSLPFGLIRTDEPIDMEKNHIGKSVMMLEDDVSWGRSKQKESYKYEQFAKSNNRQKYYKGDNKLHDLDYLDNPFMHGDKKVESTNRFESKFNTSHPETFEEGTSFIDQQYFDNQSSSGEPVNKIYQVNEASEHIPKADFPENPKRKTDFTDTLATNTDCSGYIDEQYFQHDSIQSSKSGENLASVDYPKQNTNPGPSDRHTSFLDEQYSEYDPSASEPFYDKSQANELDVFLSKADSHEKHERTNCTGALATNIDGSYYIDDQYFQHDNIPSRKPDENSASVDYVKQSERKRVHLEKRTTNTIPANKFEHCSNDIDNQYIQNNNQSLNTHATTSVETFEKEVDSNYIDDQSFQRESEKKKTFLKSITDRSFKANQSSKSQKEVSVEKLSRTFRQDNQMKSGSNLRGKMDPKQYDSEGYRILTGQVPSFDNVSALDVVEIIQKSIIYNDNDIVAIDKPYGLAVHGGPGIKHSIGQLRGKILSNTELHPVHRLDKHTTGVMLLAKTETMARQLHECFYKRGVKKRYLAITKNIPVVKQGEIDIPLAEGTIDNKTRTVLRPYNSPELDKRTRSQIPGHEAVTRYRVLDQGVKCAIVECLPLTGLKHQIRAHLAFGLNCPILGDHKYASIDKMAPMRLHPEMLKMLKVRQSKVRHIALHLHARSIMIPEFLNGENFFISAPLPLHFVANMHSLKLRLPSGI